MTPADDGPTMTSIANQSTNEATEVSGISFTVDEGGHASDVAEDNHGATLTIATSSTNANLLPQNNANIKIYKDGTAITPSGGGGSALSFDLEAVDTTDVSAAAFTMTLDPADGQNGTVTVTMTTTVNGLTAVNIFTLTVSDTSALHNGWTEIYAVGPKEDRNTYLEDLVVRIGWNAMTMLGTSSPTVSGYHVYRGEASAGPFTKLTSTALSSSTLTYTDTSLTNSNKGTLYYYKVVPVDSVNSLETATAGENYSVVRVVAPPSNMAFVSRRMVNKEICEKMGFTADKSNYNRCVYGGPGDQSFSFKC